MYTGYAHEDGTVSDLIIDHYREMATIGVALVITEHTCIDQKSGGTKRMLHADENRFIPELGQLNKNKSIYILKKWKTGMRFTGQYQAGQTLQYVSGHYT